MDEKIKALAKVLNRKPNEIEISTYDENTFIVNPHSVLQGNSPEYYQESIREFKKLLDNKSINRIDNYLNGLLNANTEKKLLKIRKRWEKTYRAIEKIVSVKPVIKDWLYNSNILYWLLNIDEVNHTTSKSLKLAWLDLALDDERVKTVINDGEYLILTNSEADKLWDEDLENYIDECIINDLPESYQVYFDREAWKEDARTDGRAHSLSRYDGNELEQDGFYIYRTG